MQIGQISCLDPALQTVILATLSSAVRSSYNLRGFTTPIKQTSHKHHGYTAAWESWRIFKFPSHIALSVEHQHCSVAEQWNHLWETIQKAGFATFGKKTSKRHYWFIDAKFSEVSPVIDAKRAALAENKLSPSEKTLQHSEQQEAIKIQQTASQNMCKQILATARRPHPVCGRVTQQQRTERGYQESFRSNTEQNSPPQFYQRRSDHRQG